MELLNALAVLLAYELYSVIEVVLDELPSLLAVSHTSFNLYNAQLFKPKHLNPKHPDENAHGNHLPWIFSISFLF